MNNTIQTFNNTHKALHDYVDDKDKGVAKRDTLGGTFSITVEQDRTEEYITDPTADAVMTCLKDKLSPDLVDYLYGMLQGFNTDTQTAIANALLEFVTEKTLRLTGFPSVDTVLAECYNLIAEEKGIDAKEISYLLE